MFREQGSAFRPGQQGELPDGIWAVKQFPIVAPIGSPTPNRYLVAK
jgi:hypothetical protein